MAKFEEFLHTFDEAHWLQVVDELSSTIHEVDRDAAQIWFRFYPLGLFRYLQNAEDKTATLHGFAMQGDFDLKDQIDSSHHFLYGHRYWNAVKKIIIQRAESFKGAGGELITEVKQIAQSVSNEVNQKVTLTTGISLVGLMTLVRVGFDNFKSSKGEIKVSENKSPNAIVAERAKDDSQGILGFLRTVDKQYTITFSSMTESGKFKAFDQQEITSAAMKSDVKTDKRCFEGPIPVECKSASCGTCWVGVLGGAKKISAVSKREAKQMKVFGYNQPEETHPFLRLSCQSKISGNVTLVIPPWNGVFGRKVRGVEDVELEPATTSAKKLRETIADAVGK